MEIGTHNLWDVIVAHQGETFYTASKLPFTYTVRGGEFFTERKKKSITRATFERALEKVVRDAGTEIVGPKTLNVFGAPYVWAIFAAFGLVKEQEEPRKYKKRIKGQLSFLPEDTTDDE